MVFTSDRQRKAVMAKLTSGTRSNVMPSIMRRMKPRLRPEVRNFVAKKIRANIKEGKPTKQSIAIAFSQARKKFPKDKKALTQLVSNPNGKLTQKRIINLLVLLFGVSVALRILRGARN